MCVLTVSTAAVSSDIRSAASGTRERSRNSTWKPTANISPASDASGRPHNATIHLRICYNKLTIHCFHWFSKGFHYNILHVIVTFHLQLAGACCRVTPAVPAM